MVVGLAHRELVVELDATRPSFVAVCDVIRT